LFLIFGGGNDPYQLMPPYWGGRPRDAGVFESQATHGNGAVFVDVPNHGTNTANGGTGHGHSLAGQSQGANITLSHTVNGETGNPTGAVGVTLDVRPRTVTVNYIIKI
jgi:hypothetical protein